MQCSTGLSLIYTIEGGWHTEASCTTLKMRFKSCRNGITVTVLVLFQTVNRDGILCITSGYTNKGGNESVHNTMKSLCARNRIFGALNTSFLMCGLSNFVFKCWKIQNFKHISESAIHGAIVKKNEGGPIKFDIAYNFPNVL